MHIEAIRNLLLLLLLAFLVSVLAYQAPPHDTIAIGWLGDQLFLNSDSGLRQDAVEQGDWYADALTPDSPTGRSRWTRQHAILTLPNIGAGVPLRVTLVAQGWPADIVANHTRQPTVTLRADGSIVGGWVPTPQWDSTSFVVPAHLRTSADLVLELETSDTFTDTLRGADPRPKGVRLAAVQVQGDGREGWGQQWREAGSFGEQVRMLLAQVCVPAWRAVGLLLLNTLLLSLLLIRLLRSPQRAFLLSTLAVGGAGAGLALWRIWMGGLFQVVLWLLVGGLLLAWHRPLLRLLRGLLVRYRQGHTLNYGLITAALVWSGYALAKTLPVLLPVVFRSRLWQAMFPDSILVGLLIVCLLALLLVAPGHEGLPRIARTIVRLFRARAFALTLVIGGIWLAYQTAVIARLPYVGHADYADNAVVARNLLAGRGWVVDYITQFYHLYDGVTRPQETWPLLQPVWIMPFFALFGEQAWAAKLPNLFFSGVLLLLIFAAGARMWNRRVGALAALLILTNHLFVTLNIYTTSDLGFVVFATAALYVLFLGGERIAAATTHHTQPGGPPGFLLLVGSGLLTGLMMLQKPSGAMIAVGMGVWLIIRSVQLIRYRVTLPLLPGGRFLIALPAKLLPVLVWALPALLVLSPYLVRNQLLFDTPVYSTERYDAWVLGYRGSSEEAWNDIYRVYTPALGGEGVPDRSWILRWGFDRSLEKLETQVRAVRDYLLPAWDGLSNFLSSLLDSNEHKNLLAPVGAWLSALGGLAALRLRRHLLNLLLLAFAPYTLFLITYWHANEERYFLVVMPWLAMLAAWMIWAAYDRLAAIGDGRWSPLALILVGVAVVHIVQPSWPIIQYKVQEEPQRWAPDLVAYAWLREETPPDAVVMTRNPWQLNWHSERPAVMIPNTSDYDILMFLARYYDAEYLVFETIQRIKGDAARLLHRLAGARSAQVGDTIDGFTLVYASPTPENRVLIYRFPGTSDDK
jgi:4-amino-4-deoxy-L-arabinose transferase-like glycosyltransferase